MPDFEVTVNITVTHQRKLIVTEPDIIHAGAIGLEIVTDEWLDGEGPYMATELGQEFAVAEVVAK